MIPDWLRLDNAAKVFPSVTTARITHFFRLSVRLRQPVQPALVAQALANLAPRFPLFQYQLRPGFFWFSLIRSPQPPVIFPETPWPCMPFRRPWRGPHLVRVRLWGRRMAVEFSHALTDGLGGLTYLRSLTTEYLRLAGTVVPDWGTVPRPDQPPTEAELADAFQDLFVPTLPQYSDRDRAFQLPFPLLPKGQYSTLTGHLPLQPVLDLARQRGVSLTEFLAALLLEAFQTVFEALPAAQRRRQARPLRLIIPVNLRRLFPAATLRNFFVVVPVEIDLRLGHYDFEEILRKVHHQLQSEMDKKLMLKQIARNLRGELNPLVRLFPLTIKNLILRTVFGRFERRQTASLSNLGAIDLPVETARQAQDFAFLPPPSPFSKVNCGVVSFGDDLALTFGSLTPNPAVERAFFSRLRQWGIPVMLETNRIPEES